MEEGKVCGRDAEPGHIIGARGSEWALSIRSDLSGRPRDGTGVTGNRVKSRNWGFRIGVFKRASRNKIRDHHPNGCQRGGISSLGDQWSGHVDRSQVAEISVRTTEGRLGACERQGRGSKGRTDRHWVKRGVLGQEMKSRRRGRWVDQHLGDGGSRCQAGSLPLHATHIWHRTYSRHHMFAEWSPSGDERPSDQLWAAREIATPQLPDTHLRVAGFSSN